MTTSSSMPSGDFRLFLQKIAMQGFFSLGLVEIPGAPKSGVNLGMAQSVIGDLQMLKERTEGNLDEGERQTLDKYLSDLQLQYLAAEKNASGEEEETTREDYSPEEDDPGK